MKSDPFSKTEEGSAKSLLMRDASREDIVVQALQQCQAAIDAGESIDREAILEKFPTIRDELSACLEGLELLKPVNESGAKQPSHHSSQSAKQSLSPSAALGDFRIEREIGRGGMGVVYEAEQLSVGRKVALKVLPYAAMLDKRQVARFQNEARAAATLEHPNIVPVYFVGNERGVYYYAMRLIDGKNLAEVLAELRGHDQDDAPLSLITSQLVDNRVLEPDSPEGSRVDFKDRETVRDEVDKNSTSLASHGGTQNKVYFESIARLAKQTAGALEFAHSQGIIHRDIKPANIMLDDLGDAWVTDFGLARIESDAGMTMTGDLVGTLRYMAPEQALAKRVIVDHRCDIYSLGATIYEMLTLRPLFEGADRAELLKKIAFQEPRPPSKVIKGIPSDLETIILKTLEKNPDDRYPSASALAEDLKRFLAHKPVLARRTPTAQRVRMWARRHPTVAASAATVTSVVLLATAVLGLLSASHERSLRTQEQQSAKQIAATLSEKEEALAVASANRNEALDAIDQFLIELSNEGKDAIPPSSPLRKELIESAFGIYDDLEKHNQMTPDLERRKLSALVWATDFDLLDDPELQSEWRTTAMEIVNRRLAENPNDLLAIFSKIRLVSIDTGPPVLRTSDAESAIDLIRGQLGKNRRYADIFQSKEIPVEYSARTLSRLMYMQEKFGVNPEYLTDFPEFVDAARDLLTQSEGNDIPVMTYLAMRTAAVARTFGYEDVALDFVDFAVEASTTVPVFPSLESLVREKRGSAAARDFAEEQLRRYEVRLVEYPRSERAWGWVELQISLAENLKHVPDLASYTAELEKQTKAKHPLVRRNVLLATLYGYLGNEEKQMHYYEQSAATNFGEFSVRIGLSAARVYVENGEYEKALHSLGKFDFSYVARRRSSVLYQHWLLQGERSLLKKSLAEYARSIEIDSSKASVFHVGPLNGSMTAVRIAVDCDDQEFKDGLAALAEHCLESNSEEWSDRKAALLAMTYLGRGERALQSVLTEGERQAVLTATRLEKQLASNEIAESRQRNIEAWTEYVINQGDRYALNNLLWTLAAETETDSLDSLLCSSLAHELASTIKADSAESANHWNTAGVAWYRSGEFRKAINGLERSSEISQNDLLVTSNDLFIAMSCWQLGDFEQAVHHHQNALSRISDKGLDSSELSLFVEEAAQVLETARPR